MERLRIWETASTHPEHLTALLAARPVASPEIRFHLLNRLTDGQWIASECWLESDAPFPVKAQAPLWTASLVARCDGSKTARELLEAFKGSDTLPPDTREEEFAGVVQMFISAGFLRLE